MGEQLVGVLGVAGASVDERGNFPGKGSEWLIGAEDRWHDPRTEPAVRQKRQGVAPIFETRLRIPSGDAVQWVYGARAGDGTPVTVMEVENESPAPFAFALVVHCRRFRRRGATIDLDGDAVIVNDRVGIVLPRPPLRWATAREDEDVRAIVTSGAAAEGPFRTVHGKHAAHAAFVFPVAHRTKLRLAITYNLREARPGFLASLPARDAVERGWSQQLQRGMRVEVPEPLQGAIDAARAKLFLWEDFRPSVVAALEDWGFDDAAAEVWVRLSMRDRSRAARREFRPGAWNRVRSGVDTEQASTWLRYVRDVVIHDRGETIDLLPGFPDEWVGESIAVHDAPTRAGLVSFAVRWHGERPALIWEAPAGVELRAPALDPSWSSTQGTGEALLALWRRSA